jgi:hypothetical protein
MLLKSTCCTNIKLSCTNIYTVKLAHVVTSIKQSPVLNHNFLVMSLVVVHRSSETSTNQSDVIIRSDDRFLNLVVDSDSIVSKILLNFVLWLFCWFFLSSYWQKYCSFIPAVFFALILTNIWQFCPSLLLTFSQYTYLD